MNGICCVAKSLLFCVIAIDCVRARLDQVRTVYVVSIRALSLTYYLNQYTSLWKIPRLCDLAALVLLIFVCLVPEYNHLIEQ